MKKIIDSKNRCVNAMYSNIRQGGVYIISLKEKNAFEECKKTDLDISIISKANIGIIARLNGD